jgi:prepilin-type N-terminal cleavage/methylation domain-containing protein
MKIARAFTLIEMLVSLAVFAVIMVTVASAFLKIYQDWARQKDYFQTLGNAQWAMRLLSSEIRQGNSSSVSDVGITGMVNHTFLSFLFAENGNLDHKIWYWKGDGATHGNVSFLYRAFTDDSDTFAHANTTAHRMELARFLVNTTSGEIFNVTDRGSTNSTVTIELNMRPKPNQPEVSGNRNYTLRTRVRPRN